MHKDGLVPMDRDTDFSWEVRFRTKVRIEFRLDLGSSMYWGGQVYGKVSGLGYENYWKLMQSPHEDRKNNLCVQDILLMPTTKGDTVKKQ